MAWENKIWVICPVEGKDVNNQNILGFPIEAFSSRKKLLAKLALMNATNNRPADCRDIYDYSTIMQYN